MAMKVFGILMVFPFLGSHAGDSPCTTVSSQKTRQLLSAMLAYHVLQSSGVPGLWVCSCRSLQTLTQRGFCLPIPALPPSSF